ncbi:MarR family winged helix-turn-helix transcriptional regulator [Dactylosporangium darangshiense]|uniref:MarR family transcriptional regulator n=1 Tax=Dactylosporangium darangshiense TaxID=579108 RepID=A0ABP8DK15_9ACTN
MDSTAAWATLLRVHAALTPLLDQELQAAHGLPLTWYDVLLELNAAPGRRLTMSALGAAAVVSRSRVSRVVDELERAGLVEREANPDDRRSAFAKLTPAGRARLRAASPTYVAGIERHFTGRMSRTEAQAVAAALGKVLRAHDASTVVPLQTRP